MLVIILKINVNINIIRSRNCVPFGTTCIHPHFFGGVRVAHFAKFILVKLIYLFLFVLSLVYPMLSVDLDCPFLVVPWVFSNL